MVAQLRYQDPMNPTDSSEFLAQSAQFTALEKMQDVADQTGALLGTQIAFGAERDWSASTSPGSTPTASTQHRRPSTGVTLRRRPGPVLDVGGAEVAARQRPSPSRPDRHRLHRRTTRTAHHPPASDPTTSRKDTTMLRSLFAGISGLRVNQTMLDVTGNNIANANTIGFKASTTVFQDTLSQMLHRRRRRQRRPRRHQPDPGRPRRPARRHHAPTSTRARPRPPAARPT